MHLLVRHCCTSLCCLRVTCLSGLPQAPCNTTLSRLPPPPRMSPLDPTTFASGCTLSGSRCLSTSDHHLCERRAPSSFRYVCALCAIWILRRLRVRPRVLWLLCRLRIWPTVFGLQPSPRAPCALWFLLPPLCALCTLQLPSSVILATAPPSLCRRTRSKNILQI